MTTQRPTDWREARRLRAFDLHLKGWTGSAIAEALGVTKGAVSHWLKAARQGGREALRARRPSGRPPKLKAEELAQLPTLLQQGAEAFGFRGAFWTRARVAEVIRRTFGVSYHKTHVGRLLKMLGWTRQKPLKRATQRDEAAIERWVREDWPRIKKKPLRRDAP